MLYKNLYIEVFKRKKYFKFLISGFSAALVNIFSLYIFHGLLEIQIVIATSLSFILAYFVSFTLQKFWTFADDSQDRLVGQMLRYLFVGLFGLGVNAGGMYLLVEVWGIFYILAQVFMSAGLAVLNYFMYRIIFAEIPQIKNKSKSPKNILIASGIYPPDAGGPASYSKMLKDELSVCGYEIKIVSYGESEDGDKVNNIFRISRKQNVFFRYLKYFWQVFRLAKWADLVYVQGPVSEGLPSYLASRFRRKRYFLKVVGDFAWEQASQRSGVTDLLDDFQNKNYSLRVELWRLIEIFVAHGAERVVVPSEYLKKIVLGWGIPEGDISVIYNSVPEIKLINNKEALRSELGLSGHVLLSAGRLVPWKGFSVLFQALKKLSKKINDIRLYVAGDGPDLESLKKLASELELGGQVVFLGRLDHDTLWKYMGASDLFVLNTAYEGLSHVLIEAMQTGLPIVTTRVGGNVELIDDGRSGLLVSFDDEEGLTRVLGDSLDDYGSALVRAEEAKKSLSKFSKEKMIESVQNLFSN